MGGTGIIALLGAAWGQSQEYRGRASCIRAYVLGTRGHVGAAGDMTEGTGGSSPLPLR